MKIENIELYEYFNLKSDRKAKLTVYIPDETAKGIEKARIRPAVLIIPGGGYTHIGIREGEPIAIKFMSEGFIPFVLEYSTENTSYPTQQIEASLAMALIRGYGVRFNANQYKVAVIGFSAGAHLACSLSCIYDEKEVENVLSNLKYFKENGLDKIKADALILCYPVISSNEHVWHKGSFEALTNGNNELIGRLSLEKRIKEGFPPTYIWHTTTDKSVPTENSLLLALSLQKNNIPYELHIYEKGIHGLSLANKTVSVVEPDISYGVENWFNEVIAFLKSHGVRL